jgi:hypothetical protein
VRELKDEFAELDIGDANQRKQKKEGHLKRSCHIYKELGELRPSFPNSDAALSELSKVIKTWMVPLLSAKFVIHNSISSFKIQKQLSVGALPSVIQQWLPPNHPFNPKLIFNS